MSDEGTDLIYKRYKILTHETKMNIEQIDEEADKLIHDFRMKRARIDNRRVNDPHKLANHLHLMYTKKIRTIKIQTKLEAIVSKIRHDHSMKKITPDDVWNDKDPNFPGYPLDDYSSEANNLRLPEEIRKLYNLNNPEL